MSDNTFQKELEFVQLLCNTDYIKWLFENGYFDDESFLKLLRHLKYWKQPEYKKHLTYPLCLKILDILNGPDIHVRLNNESFYDEIVEQQFEIWKNNSKL